MGWRATNILNKSSRLLAAFEPPALPTARNCVVDNFEKSKKEIIMTKQLPMAINPSATSKQHVLENLLNCFTFVDTENKLVIAYPVFLHLGYTKESAQAVLSKPMLLQYTNHKGFVPREDFFVSIPQIGELIVNAPETKYVSHILEFVKNTLQPLFNEVVKTQELDLLPTADTTIKTMSSLEIAELTGKLHKNVLVDIEKLINELGGQLKIQPSSYINKQNKKQPCYNLDRESALLVTSGYSTQLRLKIIRRLDELESAKPIATEVVAPALPTSYKDALLMLAQKVGETEELASENERLIKTKMQIGSKREATAMSTAGVMAKKIKQLEAQLSLPKNDYQYATILAIQSRLKYIKVSGLKLTYFCNRNGLAIKDIPDDRYGAVHSYPAQAWKDVYQIDINAVLNKVA